MRSRLVLARWLAGMGVLPMLMSTTFKVSCAIAVTTFAAALGIGSATAQSNDYSRLPVDPNTITDSLAYAAAPLAIDPDGQPGVRAEYTHREGGTRQITTTILVLADPGAATAALNGAAADVANQHSQPVDVGTGGTMVTGTSRDGTESVAVLTFTEGNTATTIEFEGPANDPAPADLVTELGQKQAAAITNWQGA
ncbi:hypothetical protein [Mycolicibacterium novocastrense]|nr:hypothetical protein [Mycolicibacterium novocastrense]